jgi:hypothetical protein
MSWASHFGRSGEHFIDELLSYMTLAAGCRELLGTKIPFLHVQMPFNAPFRLASTWCRVVLGGGTDFRVDYEDPIQSRVHVRIRVQGRKPAARPRGPSFENLLAVVATSGDTLCRRYLSRLQKRRCRCTPASATRKMRHKASLSSLLARHTAEPRRSLVRRLGSAWQENWQMAPPRP